MHRLISGSLSKKTQEYVTSCFLIPEDIAIIGFDNIIESKVIEPALSTLDVPRFSIGESAAEVLLSQIRSVDFYHKKIEISTTLELRGSH